MTSLLLDTNVLIWFLQEDPKLESRIIDMIDQAPQVFVSTISIWEIAIKRHKGKLQIAPDYIDYTLQSGFQELPATFLHAKRTETLPNIHNDPFDRLLIAQALCENLTIVTRDAHILQYPVNTLAA